MLIGRTYECALGHRWKDVVDRNDPLPDNCPICDAIANDQAWTGSNNPPPEIAEVPGAPAVREESSRLKAVHRFENAAFKQPNSDGERVLLTNLRDNVREGESYIVPETPATNETMRMMRDQIEYQREHAGEFQNQMRTTHGASYMLPMGGGWQGQDAMIGKARVLQQTGGQSTLPGRSAVELKGKALPK